MATSLLPQYWYVAAESHELTSDTALHRQVLNEWLVCYRDEQGQAVIAQDRCIHRCARLSGGTVKDGKLSCRYHGWVYGEGGKVVSIPVEANQGEELLSKRKIKARTYSAVEQDGYVYVCLKPGPHTPSKPFLLSDLAPTLKGTVRLQNRFGNSLANCVENYIDVPHTAYVHHGIFRKPKGEALRTTVTRAEGRLKVEYHGERMNLGTFSFFLNPYGKEIVHTDYFFAPNVTSVHYLLPCGYRYTITSQSIPVSQMETMVYTTIGYDFGLLTPFSKWIVRRQAQKVIDQDIDILDEQGRNIQKYGEHFYATSADAIHTLTSQIICGLDQGCPSSELASENREITFCV